MAKESFRTITKQFTLAPVRNRNLSYIFSGPTNILGFFNLSKYDSQMSHPSMSLGVKIGLCILLAQTTVKYQV